MMSRSAKRLLVLLYASQTLFVASTFRTWIPVCIAALLAAVIVAIRSLYEEPTTERSRLFKSIRNISLFVFFTLLVVVTTAWRVSTQVGEMINVIYVGTDTLAHVTLLSGLAVWTLRPHRGHKSMLPLGLFVVLLCVAGGGTSLSLAAQTTVALATCLGFTLASQVILGGEKGRGGQLLVRDASPEEKAPWLGPVLSLLTLSLLLMATSAIASGTDLVLPGIQKTLREKIDATFDQTEGNSIIGGTRYVRGSRLGQIRRHMLGDPNAMALRVHSDFTPGYLRGYSFDIYRNRRWTSIGSFGSVQFEGHSALRDRIVTPTAMGSIDLKEPGSKPLRRFPLAGPANEPTINLEIHSDSSKGMMVFTPLTTRWVEAFSRELIVTTDGIVRVGVDVTHPYVAGVGNSVLREDLDPMRRELLLKVPDSVSEETQRVAADVAGSARGAPAKAAAIANFFQREFSYAMTSTEAPRRVDPLRHFLVTRHEAHCEYFASATVLILRSAGIPARYVTGYVVDEFDEAAGVWMARNRDAHAWAEAYDDATGKWFPVESTPGRSYRTIDPNENLSASESFFDVFRGNNDGGDNDGLISNAIGWLLSIRATDPLLVLFRLAQLPLFCVLVFLLWTKYFRPAKQAIDPIDIQSRKLLRIADRRAGKHELVRSPSETLYQFAERIDAHQRDADSTIRVKDREHLQLLSRWYRAFADARYQGKLPSPIT